MMAAIRGLCAVALFRHTTENSDFEAKMPVSLSCEISCVATLKIVCPKNIDFLHIDIIETKTKSRVLVC